MTYLEELKADIKSYIFDNAIELPPCEDRNEIHEYLNELLWCEDSVTGNASGSYTFSREKAKEKVLADTGTVMDALEGLGCEAAEVGEHFLREDWEWFDVTTRCYLLDTAIYEVLDEMEA